MLIVFIVPKSVLVPVVGKVWLMAHSVGWSELSDSNRPSQNLLVVKRHGEGARGRSVSRHTLSSPGHTSQPVPLWEQIPLLFPSWQPCLLTWPSVWSVGVWGAALVFLSISRRQLGSAISRKHSGPFDSIHLFTAETTKQTEMRVVQGKMVGALP